MKIDKGVMYLVEDYEFGGLKEFEFIEEEEVGNWIKEENFESDIILEFYVLDELIRVVYDKKYSKEEVIKEVRILEIKLFG